jgi:hypothetical protein
MKKMKKTFLIIAFVGMIFTSCNTKNNPENLKSNNATVTINDTITDFDRLEGKVVMSTSGEWFVIKDGQRWRAMSEAATTDYLKSIENGQENVVKNVSVKTLEQFPISGEILPKLEFKKDKATQ